MTRNILRACVLIAGCGAFMPGTGIIYIHPGARRAPFRWTDGPADPDNLNRESKCPSNAAPPPWIPDKHKSWNIDILPGCRSARSPR